MSQVISLLTVSVSMLCCVRENPSYCKGRNPDNNCTEPVVCTDNNSCVAPTGVCDTRTMVCVRCTPDTASACTGTTPICGVDHSCHGCSVHSDCSASNACLPDGSCATADSVAYVSVAPGGTDNPTCSFASPCTRVAAALATGRPYVKFHGLIDEAVLVSGGRSVTFLADPGAELTRSTGNGAIVTVQDDQTSLSIYDLSISNAPNSSSGIGCLIPSGAGAATLSLTRARITNNPGGGIVTAVGVAAVMRSSIAGNQDIGASSSSARLSVTQSIISGNRGGGISVFGGEFVIVGNVLVDNGWLMSTVGGISITTRASPANRLDFNSFALNTSQDGVGPAIQCIAAAFTAKNNIMSDNRTSSLVANQFGGACMHAYTIARPGTLPPGIGNGISDPLFVDPAKGDLHLQANSPARHAADPASDITGIASHDIDGNARVAPADIGAYQFR